MPVRSTRKHQAEVFVTIEGTNLSVVSARGRGVLQCAEV